MSKPSGDKQIYRVQIEAPIQRVWDELVDTASLRPFFYNALCDTPGLKPGAPYRMVSKNRKFAFVVGRVLEIEPPHRYAYTFKFTNTDDPPCKVTYTLKETDGGVEFSLITEGVPAGTQTEKSMASGGKWITQNLKAYIETGKVTFGARLMLGMMSLMTPLTPKTMHIDNWPYESLE